MAFLVRPVHRSHRLLLVLAPPIGHDLQLLLLQHRDLLARLRLHPLSRLVEQATMPEGLASGRALPFRARQSTSIDSS